MAKTRRELAESLKVVDMAIEALDARVPISSQNPEIARILAGRPKVVALNKSDLADPRANESWRRKFDSDGEVCALVDAKTGKGVAPLREQIARVSAEKARKHESRGVVSRPVRVMVVGIPNSGKSTIINTLARRASAITGDRPGVTRARQWIRLGGGVELLDTPGVLWPKFDDEAVGFRLAATGAIKDEVVDAQAVAERLLRTLSRDYPALLESRYGFAPDEPIGGGDDEALPMLRAVCSARGFVMRGGVPDLARAAAAALDEFRAARIGRITLEWPKERQ